MGVVYLAHDPRLRRRVAVKTHTLPEGLTPDRLGEFQERFLREARAAARLSHPGIVTVYDSDEDPGGGAPFIAMEYVEGGTLRQRIETEGSLPPDEAVGLTLRLADALAVAHDAGITHRDVKPANVLIRDSDGEVKIADFGVARLTDSDLTGTGNTLGSPAYMSPEQVQGREPDGRSDLFSLAVILYEMLAGERPFRGDDPVSLAYAIVHETPVPISRRADGVPDRLDRFFDRALAKDPADRFADARAFAEGLREAMTATAGDDVEATVVDAADGPRGTAAPVPGSDDRPKAPWDDEPPLFRTPRNRGQLIAGVAVAVVAFLALWVMVGGEEEGHLSLQVKSSLRNGQLTVRANGSKIFKRKLRAEEDKQGFIRKVLDQPQESFETLIDVEPGALEIVAEVREKGNKGVQEASVVVDVEPGETRRLKLVVGRKFGSPLSLRVEG
jgi:serine/threonine protein kinase